MVGEQQHIRPGVLQQWLHEPQQESRPVALAVAEPHEVPGRQPTWRVHEPATGSQQIEDVQQRQLCKLGQLEWLERMGCVHMPMWWWPADPLPPCAHSTKRSWQAL